VLPLGVTCRRRLPESHCLYSYISYETLKYFVTLSAVCAEDWLYNILFVLCRSLYCFCVYVHWTTATGWLPNCS